MKQRKKQKNLKEMDCIQLKKEKEKNIKKILCVDFDDTLCVNGYLDIKNAKRYFIHKIIMWYCKILQKKGWIIILNTCRKGKKLKEASLYLKKLNFFPNLINKNVKFLIDIYGDTRKISCNLNIDDTNFGLLGFILRLFK